MAVRFTSTFYSEHEQVKYRIDIVDTTYASTATTIFIQECSITYEQQGDERFNPIKGSKCALDTIISNDAAGTALLSWINSTVNAQEEDQFFIEVYKTNALYWRGVLLADLGTREDAPAPYVYTITATDGLARLKDKDFDYALTATGRQTFIKYIYEILKETPLYSTSENLLFSTVVDWYENQMPAKSGSNDPLLYTIVEPYSFTEVDDAGVRKAKSMYDSLVLICEAWCMRVMLSDGLFRFYQVNAYEDSGATLYEIFYLRSTGGFDSSATFTTYPITITNDAYPYVNAGNQFQWFAPLQYVFLKYPFENSNMLNTLEEMPLSGGVYEYDTDIRDGIVGGTNVKLQFETTLRLYVLPGVSGLVTVNISVYIDLGGSKYLLKPLTTSPGGASWDNFSSSWYEFQIRNVNVATQYLPIYIQTPDIPAGTYNTNRFIIEVTSVVEQSTGNTLVAGTDYTCYRQNGTTFLKYNSSSTDTDQDYYLYQAGNTSTPINSYDIELSDAVFGEAVDTSNPRYLYVWNGAAWITSSGQWRLNDTGTAYNFNMLRVREVMAGQVTATEKYQGRFIGDLMAHNSLAYNGYIYILNGATQALNAGTWDGEWYVVSIDRLGPYDIVDEEIFPIGGGEIELRRETSTLSNRLETVGLKADYKLIKTTATGITLEPINQTLTVTGAVTITLPPAADWITEIEGETYSIYITIKNYASGGDTVTIDGNASETIDGATSQTLAQYESMTLFSDGTDIMIVT